jgi:hypothetical protein
MDVALMGIEIELMRHGFKKYDFPDSPIVKIELDGARSIKVFKEREVYSGYYTGGRQLISWEGEAL